ncbi:MAG: hypothetical protein HY649_02290 [Acidobacteria bacterium]|nr:hypothetical protein [Acidobacteriota bacterium]
MRRPQEIATRHFEESLFLLKLVPCAPGLLIDVGSGTTPKPSATRFVKLKYATMTTTSKIF